MQDALHLFERTLALSKKILIASRHSIVRHGINLMVHAATPHTVISDDRPLRQVAADLAFIQPDLAIVDLMGRAESVDIAIVPSRRTRARPRRSAWAAGMSTRLTPTRCARR